MSLSQPEKFDLYTLEIFISVLVFYTTCFAMFFQLAHFRVLQRHRILPLTVAGMAIYYMVISHKVSHLVIAGFPTSLTFAIDGLIIMSITPPRRVVSAFRGWLAFVRGRVPPP
jgi:hypothetical protein